jgi:ABC-2 type transport system ATP-binding protein
VAPKARAQVGYVSERPDHGYRWMTCRGLLKHVAAYHPTWDHPYADRLSLAFGLRLDRKVATLSKGESRRLQLVLALAHRPPVLLLHEPTDGLDPVVRSRTLFLLHLADTSTTILISTHQIHELESLADHVGVLRDGRLVVGPKGQWRTQFWGLENDFSSGKPNFRGLNFQKISFFSSA